MRIRAARRGREVIHRLHCLRSNSCKACAACCLSCASRLARKRSRVPVTGSSGSPKRWTHSSITCASRSSPNWLKSCFPALFICFHAGLGSMTRSPSAMERQRRRATRKSCTGSAARATPVRSHSSSTRSIQKARPDFFGMFRVTATIDVADMSESGGNWPPVFLPGTWQWGYCAWFEAHFQCLTPKKSLAGNKTPISKNSTWGAAPRREACPTLGQLPP